MDEGPDGEQIPRPPTADDLRLIAERLNAEGARYAVIGGFAMQRLGFARPTQDIDLLVDPAEENVERLRRALAVLPDKAVLEVRPTDLVDYSVVRVADEVVVDLLAAACGVTFQQVSTRLEYEEMGGTDVPYVGPEDLLSTKRTIRPKDAMDRDFLERLLAGDL
jgi:hypothetical protein